MLEKKWREKVGEKKSKTTSESTRIYIDFHRLIIFDESSFDLFTVLKQEKFVLNYRHVSNLLLCSFRRYLLDISWMQILHVVVNSCTVIIE